LVLFITRWTIQALESLWFYWLLSDIWLWSDHPCWYPFSIGYCTTIRSQTITKRKRIPKGIIRQQSDDRKKQKKKDTNRDDQTTIRCQTITNRKRYPVGIHFLLVIDCHLIVFWSSLLVSFSIGYCLPSDCGLIIPVGILFYWLLSDIWLWSDHPCWYLFLLVIVWHLIVVWSSLLVSFSIGYCLTSDCGLIIPVGIFFFIRSFSLWVHK
jgi:hypothetical protein